MKKRVEGMPTKTLRACDLDQFTGSEKWYRHGLARTITFTDGAKLRGIFKLLSR
jgi:hypothetical protein